MDAITEIASERPKSNLEQLARGGDVVTLKRATAVEVWRRGLGEVALERVDLAERRGLLVNLGKKLEEKYGVLGWESAIRQEFDQYWGQKSTKSYSEYFKWVTDKYGQSAEFSAMLKNEPLVMEYVYSQITGQGKELGKAVLGRMLQERGSSSVRLNQKTVEIETSLKRIYGKTSVIGNFLAERGGTIDTPMSLFIPITQQERFIYEKWLMSDSKDVLALDDGQFYVLLNQIGNRSGLLGMQHGYGADRRVYRRAAGRWLKPPSDNPYLPQGKREIGLAMTTKGGEKTTMRGKTGIVSGHMDLAAVQEATALQALGLVGSDVEAPVHMRGHSMAGEEMFWLAMYAQQGWRMTYEAFTPVVSNQKEFLSLFGGAVKDLGDIPGLVNRLSAEVPWWLARLTKSERAGELLGTAIGKAATTEVFGTSLGRLIASYLIDSGEIYDQAEINEIIAIHVENLKDYWYNQAVYRALTKDTQLTNEMLKMVHDLYGDQFLAVWVAKADRILHPGIMNNKLVRAGWRPKNLSRASHYAFVSRSYAGRLPE